MRFAEDNEAAAQDQPVSQQAPQVAEKPAVPSDSSVGPSSHDSRAPHKAKKASQAANTSRRLRASLESRVSTKKQSERENATSHDVQEENLVARAGRYGWDWGKEVHRSDVSGADGESDRLIRLRKEAAQDKWDLVAFDNTDRAFRSVLVGLQFIEAMKGFNKDVWIGDMCVTKATSDERFMLQVLLAASELKRAKNQDAANSRADKVRLKGLWYHAIVPLGYTRRKEA